MMYLYRFEVETEEKTLHVIVAANDQESAFTTAEQEVEKNFLKLPSISAVTLLEKKPIRQATGFVVE
ncbi:DUF3906 family protein [Alkalihalobacillus deserti]|uniref:DUF3906 family protein n=1 Tax=Alkalihalobacillus deserti TaxID=2879466 RepID=UPI001D14AB89|nr:DUF3906 family protein [Alkalihalobacillus deserti]